MATLTCCMIMLLASVTLLVKHSKKFIHSSIINTKITTHRKLSYWYIALFKTFNLFIFIFGQNYTIIAAPFLKHCAIVWALCYYKVTCCSIIKCHSQQLRSAILYSQKVPYHIFMLWHLCVLMYLCLCTFVPLCLCSIAL